MVKLFLVLMLLLPSLGQASTQLTFEGGAAWQSRNDQRIPGKGGTGFSLSDFDTGPFAVYRIYASHRFNDHHELRALYAPFSLNLDGRFSQSVNFDGATFAANTPTKAFYKFNSYRLTYAYHFDPQGDWAYAIGFTAKVRDAEVRLTQGATQKSKKNVGFVPLLNLQASRALTAAWSFQFDCDGLAAPQGRAIDAAFTLRYMAQPDGLGGYLGYRTVEGGANNDEVYNFAWIHYAIFGLVAGF